MRRTPVEKIIRIGTLVLMALWLATYLYPICMQGWPAIGMIAVAVVLYLAVALEIYQVVSSSRQGHLYFLRTISFYTNIVILVVVMGNYLVDVIGDGQINGGWEMPFVLMVLLLAYWTQTFSYVYLDSVRLSHRIGTTTTTIPLFNISQVREQEDGLLITAENGTEIFLSEKAVSADRYADLRSRLLT